MSFLTSCWLLPQNEQYKVFFESPPLSFVMSTPSQDLICNDTGRFPQVSTYLEGRRSFIVSLFPIQSRFSSAFELFVDLNLVPLSQKFFNKPRHFQKLRIITAITIRIFVVTLHALSDDFIDKAEFLGSIRSHKVVAIKGFFNGFIGLTGVLYIDIV